jgi:anaerobic magnesium-protoporphyrin IX monomethyl ester cyclase
MTNYPNLRGLRIVLANPRTFPSDLRGETHAPDKWKSERAMNFGLLVIATVLSRCGASVHMFDQEEQDNPADYTAFEAFLETATPHFFGAGIISVYQYLGALEMMERARSRGITTLLGGQSSGAFAKELLAPGSPCDYVVRGDAEETLPALLNCLWRSGTLLAIPGVAARGGAPPVAVTVESLDAASDLEYELYPNWRQHFPLVEESRACPFKCSFCANEEIANAKFRGKDPGRLVAEVERAVKLWGGGERAPVVLQCAIFGTNAKWTREFLDLARRSPHQPRFLAALRVDNHWEQYVEFAAETFDQVHFGFESGSPQILATMLKAGNPEAYLERASAAFEAFHSRGVHVGINLIFGYYGETYQTLAETFRFVLDRREHIDSAWGGPFVLYPDTPARFELPAARSKFGSDITVLSEACRRLSTYPVKASRFFEHADSVAAGSMLMRMLNTRDTYYHHYKWYVGPSPDRPLDFYTEEEFYPLLIGNSELRDIAVDMNSTRPVEVS